MYKLFRDNQDMVNSTANFTSQGIDPKEILKCIRKSIRAIEKWSHKNYHYDTFVENETNFVGIDKNNKFAKYLISNNLGISHPTMKNILIIRYEDIATNSMNIQFRVHVYWAIFKSLSKLGIRAFTFAKLDSGKSK